MPTDKQRTVACVAQPASHKRAKLRVQVRRRQRYFFCKQVQEQAIKEKEGTPCLLVDLSVIPRAKSNTTKHHIVPIQVDPLYVSGGKSFPSPPAWRILQRSCLFCAGTRRFAAGHDPLQSRVYDN